MDKMCFVLMLAILAALTIVDATMASARWWDYPHSGYCPIGTCNKVGGWRALYVGNCSAANCMRNIGR